VKSASRNRESQGRRVSEVLIEEEGKEGEGIFDPAYSGRHWGLSNENCCIVVC